MDIPYCPGGISADVIEGGGGVEKREEKKEKNRCKRKDERQKMKGKFNLKSLNNCKKGQQ